MPEPDDAPFPGERLLYLGTGSLGVMFMPSWMQWLRSRYPQLAVRPVLTRSATRFTTTTAVSLFANRAVSIDAWSEFPDGAVPHVEMTSWADAIIVHPASFNFMARFAAGLADTPTLLAIQCFQGPIAVAPAVPPGALTSPVWRQHLANLACRENVAVVSPHQGVSVSTGRTDATTAAPLPEVVAALASVHHVINHDHSEDSHEHGTAQLVHHHS